MIMIVICDTISINQTKSFEKYVQFKSHIDLGNLQYCIGNSAFDPVSSGQQITLQLYNTVV